MTQRKIMLGAALVGGLSYALMWALFSIGNNTDAEPSASMVHFMARYAWPIILTAAAPGLIAGGALDFLFELPYGGYIANIFVLIINAAVYALGGFLIWQIARYIRKHAQ